MPLMMRAFSLLTTLLTGMPPFYDKSEPRLLRSIMAGKFSFKDPVWEPVSDGTCRAACTTLGKPLLLVHGLNLSHPTY